ncbi:MAG: hypothetical protein U9N79_04130 [Actinomycetota bacterium]|nr:hypothetical protein [Actinomycetota bacterium]
MTVECVIEASVDGRAISRALDPELRRRLLAEPGSRELPCVRGRTIVPDACVETVVVGYPNYLGVFDRLGANRTIVFTGAWSSLRPVPSNATVIAIEESVPRAVAEEALRQTRRLSKRLRQVRGVEVVIRSQSPVIVVLLPHSPGDRVLALAGVTTLGSDFPEYPGGVRIEPPLDAVRSGLARYAADLERFIMEEA